MKSIKKLMALFLAVMMIMAILVVPASAATSRWRGHFQKFAVTKRTNYQTGYTCAVQSILMAYNDVTMDLIGGHGAIDGIFGSHTEDAVKIFQGDMGLTKDGSVGPATWGAMADALREDESNVLWMHGRPAITVKREGGVYNFFYHDAVGNEDSKFASVY